MLRNNAQESRSQSELLFTQRAKFHFVFVPDVRVTWVSRHCGGSSALLLDFPSCHLISAGKICVEVCCTWLRNNEFWMTWPDGASASFHVTTQHLTGRADKNTDVLDWIIPCSGQDDIETRQLSKTRKILYPALGSCDRASSAKYEERRPTRCSN